MNKEESSYQRMIKEIHDFLGNRELIFFGKMKKARDLEFVFNIHFRQVYDTASEKVGLSNNTFVIFCKQDNYNKFIDENCLNWNSDYCYDEDLFEFLNLFISKDFISGYIAVWGTGKVCDDFLNNFKKIDLKDKIKYFVCTQKEEEEKNGIKIVTPQEIAACDCKIVMAVNHKNFCEIEKECQRVGIKRERYIYFQQLMDNPGDFFKQTYNDEKYYDIECLNLDKTMRIFRDGSISVCCLSPENKYGNIYEDSLENAYNSIRAQIGRVSLLNHTYTFCNHSTCPFLAGLKNEQKKSEYEESYTYKYEKYPDCITPLMGYTCNLYCTSCRNSVLIEPDEELVNWVEVIKEKIAKLPVRLILNPQGEVLANKFCLDFIHDSNCLSRGHISLYTNGTLLDKKMLDWILDNYVLDDLSISIDASTEGTYNKIRRGGNWNQLMNNIQYISKMKKAGRIPYWVVQFVIQRDNVAELQSFVEKAEQWGVDEIEFNGIDNWGTYTDEEFQKVNVLKDGRLKEEYKKYFIDELLEDPKVYWGTFTNLLGTKHRYIRTL